MGITRQQALDCFASDDLIGIGMEADAVRRTLHPEGVVTYCLDRALNLTAPNLEAQVQAALDLGATGITLHLDQPAPLGTVETTLRHLKTTFPNLWLHGLTATNILALATAANLPIVDTLQRLQAAGLASLGSSATILGTEKSDAALRPHKCSTTDWLNVHRSAHNLGLPSTATMIFGIGETGTSETIAQRIHHLELLYELQQETHGFTSFTPLANPLNRQLDEATAVEYLKTLAISRLFLDNIPNLQSHWPTQGLKVLQMALRFGANDAGSALSDDPTTRTPASEEELRRLIRDAGLKPAQRDTPYRTIFLN
jgi:cyclic dehypoxanthinyl futalosine synthase